jgi:hypothetical protein
MEVGVHAMHSDRSALPRVCARAGCSMPVKKPTNKYCSVRCCATDPVRLERLRSQAQRSHRTVIPLTHQLSLELWGGRGSNPESEIDLVGQDREDVPRGMSHLAC